MTNTHEVALTVSRSFSTEVFTEVCRWGEARWWPKDSLMRITNLSGNCRIEEGTAYLQEVRLPFGPRWHTRIDRIQTPDSISRVFVDGIFNGYEKVTVIAGEDGKAIVRYFMDVFMKNADFFLWQAFFRRLHDAMIEKILQSLRVYCESTFVAGQATCRCAEKRCCS